MPNYYIKEAVTQTVLFKDYEDSSKTGAPNFKSAFHLQFHPSKRPWLANFMKTNKIVLEFHIKGF